MKHSYTKRFHEIFVTLIIAIKVYNNENATFWIFRLETYKSMSWNVCNSNNAIKAYVNGNVTLWVILLYRNVQNDVMKSL